MSASAAIAFSATIPAIDTAKEPLSEARLNANRANAQKSTGPRSVGGKERSRANSAKHYMRAIVVSKGIESAEVEAERRDFIESLGACDAATIKLADHAYRCSRRLEIALDAEDAALAKRIDAADAHFQENRYLEHRDALNLSEADPCVGRFRLELTMEGCEWLIELLDSAACAIREREWCEQALSQLKRALGARYFTLWDRIEPATEALSAGQPFEKQSRLPNLGAIKPDSLSRIEREIEHHKKMNVSCSAYQTALYQKELAAWEAESDRIQRTFDSHGAKLIAPYHAACQQLLALIDEERTLLLERIETLGDEENRAWALAVETAKFDASDAARLRNRYVGDARRDLSKSLDDFRKALRESQREAASATAPEPKPTVNAPVDAPRTVAAAPSPNEPKREQPSRPQDPQQSSTLTLEQDPTCNDLDGCNDRTESPTLFDIGA